MILKRARDGNSASRKWSESDTYRNRPKDIENGQVVVVRRDTREKIVVGMDELTEKHVRNSGDNSERYV